METPLNADLPMIAMVLAYFPSMKGHNPPYAPGSATLINSNALLTAAHVIYDAERGGHAEKFDVLFGDGTSSRNVPGLNGRVHSKWIGGDNGVDSAFDAGVILLDAPAAPEPARLLDVETQLPDLLGTPINIFGFPADDLVPNLYGFLYGVQTVGLNLGTALNGFKVGYPVYTYGGMSGGPVFREDERDGVSFNIRGVHTSLVDGQGHGLMLTKWLLEQVKKWAFE